MGCIESDTSTNTPVRAATAPAPRRPTRPRKQTRLSTKFKMEDVREVTDDERHAGFKPCYVCPICFLHYNSTLYAI